MADENVRQAPGQQGLGQQGFGQQPHGAQAPPRPAALQQALGGSPGSVLLRLALLSLLVGVVLAALGMTPWGFFHWLRYWIEELLGSGIDAVRNLIGYVVSGAIIVLPIWLIMRLLSTGRR